MLLITRDIDSIIFKLLDESSMLLLRIAAGERAVERLLTTTHIIQCKIIFAHKSLELVKYYVDRGYWNVNMLSLAVSTGMLNIVDYICGVPIDINLHSHDKYAVELACEYGMLDIIKCIVSYRDDITYDLGIPPGSYSSAAEYNHIDCLAYAFARYPEDTILSKLSVFYNAAIKGGNLNVILWLDERYPMPINDCFTRTAATAGDLQILQFLRARGIPYSGDTFEMAEVSGSIEILEYLLMDGCPRGHDTYNLAVINNRVNTMNWLYANGFEISDAAVWSAGKFRYKNPDAADWIVKHCKHSQLDSCLYGSAESGDIELGKRIVSMVCSAGVGTRTINTQGEIIEERLIYYALNSHQLEFVDWLLSLNCPIDTEHLRRGLTEWWPTDKLTVYIAELIKRYE